MHGRGPSRRGRGHNHPARSAAAALLPGTPAELLIPPGDTITVSHLRLGPSVLKVAHSAGSIVEFYRPPAWAAAPVLQDEDRDRIVALASAAASALETERIDIEWALLPDGTLWLVQARPLTAPLPPPDAADRPGGTQWAGLPGSPGRASGPAAPLGEAPVAPSAVLVCPALDASSVTALLGDPPRSWPQPGGTLSHTAILARELGIPAVVRVTGAMTLFSPGQYLDVDGTAGTVRLAAAPQPTSRPPGQGQRDDGRTASCVLPGAAPEGQDGEFRAVIIDGDGPASAAAVLASVGAVSPGCGILVIDPRSAVPALPPAYQVTRAGPADPAYHRVRQPGACRARRPRQRRRPAAQAARTSHRMARGRRLPPCPGSRLRRRIVGPFELAATRSWRYHGGEVWEIAADGDRYIVKRHSDGRRWRQEVAG